MKIYIFLNLILHTQAQKKWKNKASIDSKLQPNIIFVLVDDLGWSDVTWNNAKVKSTPFMAQMVRNGSHLTAAYSTHRCSPTRAALLTGRYPWRYGLGSDPINGYSAVGLSQSETLLPQILKEKSDKDWRSSYSTHIVGKWHLGNCNETFLPQNRGFDSFYGHYGGAINYFNHTKKASGIEYLDYFDGDEPNRAKSGIYSTFDFGAKTREIFLKVKKPKFIYLSLNAPHGPISAPGNIIREMQEEHPTISHSRAEYLATIKAIDLEMEKIVQTVKSKAEKRDTIIIFQSDNGGVTFNKELKSKGGGFIRLGCNFPYKGEKTLLTEGGTLVPAFAYSVKGTIRPKVYDGIFHITDWFPTILSLAKVKKSAVDNWKRIDGINQVSVLTQQTTTKQPRTNMVYGIIDRKSSTGEWNTHFAVRFGHYKFYNFQYKSVKATECEEGFGNERLEGFLRRRLGPKAYDLMDVRLKHNTIDKWYNRGLTGKGFSIYNLKSDPFELRDLSANYPLVKKLSKILSEFHLPMNHFASDFISSQSRGGKEYPITGARFDFWRLIFNYMSRDKVKNFMRDSGRFAFDAGGPISGKNYCDSSEDRRVLKELLHSRQGREDPKAQRLRKLIKQQFPYLKA